MASYGDPVKMLDLLIEAEEENLARRERDFHELSGSLNHAMSESDDTRVEHLLKLKNIARDNYQESGAILGKLKRRRAELKD